MEKNIFNQKGYVISTITFFVLVIMVSMAMSMSFLIAERQKNITNTVKSTQTYYTAEAGIEDALLRLKKNPYILPVEYFLGAGNPIATVNISNVVAGSRIITSQATNSNIVRNIKATASMSNNGNATFYYGIQAGAFGFEVGNGSTIDGNVFSGGNISGSGTINYNAIVNGNCASLHIKKDLTFTKDGATNSCTVDGETTTDTGQSASTLPIADSQITDWKNDASIETHNGNLTLSDNISLGPIKIIGNLNISNKMLTLTGTVYVTGNITISNNGGGIKLDPTVYQNSGGVIITDGKFIGGNKNSFSSSGDGSYLLILSTYVSSGFEDPAITVSNNMTGSGAAFYAKDGIVSAPNGGSIAEMTGAGILIGNGSTITTSSGVVNIYFASGTGGSWKVSSWQEY